MAFIHWVTTAGDSCTPATSRVACSFGSGKLYICLSNKCFKVYPAYSLCDRRKTLTGSPDPTCMQPAYEHCNVWHCWDSALVQHLPTSWWYPMPFPTLVAVKHHYHSASGTDLKPIDMKEMHHFRRLLGLGLELIFKRHHVTIHQHWPLTLPPPLALGVSMLLRRLGRNRFRS